MEGRKARLSGPKLCSAVDDWQPGPRQLVLFKLGELNSCIRLPSLPIRLIKHTIAIFNLHFTFHNENFAALSLQCRFRTLHATDLGVLSRLTSTCVVPRLRHSINQSNPFIPQNKNLLIFVYLQ